MKSITEKTRTQYPAIEHVTPTRVSSWLKDKQKLVLLDVREAAEFEVSHLKGSQRVEPNGALESIVQQLKTKAAKGEKVVLYCSVGVRSAKLTRRLADAGVKNVYNMNGSIFQWANEGHAVYRDDQQVSKVHPYNRKWGKLLKPELRADVKPVDGS